MPAIRFTAQRSTKGCDGCIFEKERSKVCKAASAAAAREGLPDCDDRAPGGGTFIYVLDLGDPRQLSLVDRLRAVEYEINACESVS